MPAHRHAGREADAADDTVAVTEAFSRFRRRARALLADRVAPECAADEWRQWAARAEGAGATADLFGTVEDATEPPKRTAPGEKRRPDSSPPLAVPSGLYAMAQRVVLHSDPARFDLLYRLLWRLQHEPHLRHDPLDADVLRLRQLARAVQRDAYKMRAFVRFRPLKLQDAHETRPAMEAVVAAQTSVLTPNNRHQKPSTSAQRPELSLSQAEHPPPPSALAKPASDNPNTLHVAWFEPEHDVLEAVAPWFARRFAGMRWAILTPRRSVRWSPATAQLTYGPGAQRADAPAPDAGEALWLTYYRHIFNPARLNLRMMQQHMPRRYWANLPEAAQIADLAADAQARTATMLAQVPSDVTDAALFNQERKIGAVRRQTHELSIHRAAQEIVVHTPPRDVGGVHRAPESLDTLTQLHAAIQRCTACPLAACATQAVNGRGPMRPPLMLVGEQPGDQEDLAGEPFVGPAGQLLSQALAAAGLRRESLFLTNAVRHFKHELRGKRRIHKTPGQREAAACQPWLLREIELVQPTALLALGATAARALRGPGTTLAEARGRWWPGPGGRPVRVTWHPAALLRLPDAERERVWSLWLEDLRAASEPHAH